MSNQETNDMLKDATGTDLDNRSKMATKEETEDITKDTTAVDVAKEGTAKIEVVIEKVVTTTEEKPAAQEQSAKTEKCSKEVQTSTEEPLNLGSAEKSAEDIKKMVEMLVHALDDPFINVGFSYDIIKLFLCVINGSEYLHECNRQFDIQVQQYSHELLTRKFLERVCQGLPPHRVYLVDGSNTIHCKDQWAAGMAFQRFSEVACEQWVQNLVGKVGSPLARRYLCYSNEMEECRPTGYPHSVW